MILGVMILIPLIYTEALPKGMLNTFLVAPAPPPPPPPPQPVVKDRQGAEDRISIQKMMAPTVIPKNVAMVKDEAPVIYTNSGEGVAGGTGNVLGGIIGMAAPAATPADEGDSLAHSRRRQRASRVSRQQGYAAVSADREDGSRFRYRDSARDHLQGRLDSGTAVCLRTSAC